MAAKNDSNEIAITRVYDAPVKLVWDAWVDPKQVAQWWGPRGFTLTTYKKDVRTGGEWVYTMHGPDGTNYENSTKFIEVKEHSLLEYDHGANATQPPLFRVKVRFTEQGKRTKMEMRMILATPESARETRAFVKKAGGNATWDRLGEFLDEHHQGKKRFFINRSFDAPIEKMFTLWTDPKHLSQWLAPTGFTMTYLRADMREGKESVYRMDGPNNARLFGKAHYLEIVKPTRIVYTQQFCDEQENMARHPMAPTWPATMLTLVELTDEGDGQTRVTVRWEPHGEATQEEVNTFLLGRAGMTQGWTGSFDKLEAHLGEPA